MQINRRSLLYKTAYWFVNDNLRPDKVSICRLFWRFVLVLPMLYFVAVPICLIIMAVVFLMSFLFGYCPTVCEGDDKNETWTKIAPDKWPKIKGHRVWPINILLLGLLIYYLLLEISLAINWVSGNFGLLLIALPVLFALVLVILFFSSDFFWLTVWPHLKAKKEKFCFHVEFVD